MKKILFLSLCGMFIILLGLGVALFGGGPGAASAAQAHSVRATPTLEPEQEQDVEAIRLALLNAVSGRDDVVAFLMYKVDIDHVDFDQKGNLALVWIKLMDKESGDTIPAEPGLAIARKTKDEQNGQQRWKIILQADASFASELAGVPEDLLGDEARQQYEPGQQKLKKNTRCSAVTAFRGKPGWRSAYRAASGTYLCIRPARLLACTPSTSPTAPCSRCMLPGAAR